MELLLIRYGELGVKGSNKYIFENKLVYNIKNVIKEFEGLKVFKSQSRIYVKAEKEMDFDPVVKKIQKVFGIVEICRAEIIKTDIDEIKEKCLEYMKKYYKQGQTFKIDTRRALKSFPISSNEVSLMVAEHIFDNMENIKVDVHNPDMKIKIEIREETYIYSNINNAKGLCGMPLGTNGRGILLLSGGIDSPAAGFQIAKRGVLLDCVHFMSPPYTSERAKEKVIELAKKLGQYAGDMKLYLVPFTDIQMAIYEKCKETQITLIMRRYMMKIAEIIAEKCEAQCLITGESIGQVASQTVESLYVTNEVVTRPVFRPFIGLDKEEIVTIAKNIGTYDTSILPYEDCCTVFVPKHPETKPELKYILKSESHLSAEIDSLIEKAINDMEIMEINQ